MATVGPITLFIDRTDEELRVLWSKYKAENPFKLGRTIRQASLAGVSTEYANQYSTVELVQGLRQAILQRQSLAAELGLRPTKRLGRVGLGHTISGGDTCRSVRSTW